MLLLSRTLAQTFLHSKHAQLSMVHHIFWMEKKVLSLMALLPMSLCFTLQQSQSMATLASAVLCCLEIHRDYTLRSHSIRLVWQARQPAKYGSKIATFLVRNYLARRGRGRRYLRTQCSG